jgi:putative transposase
VEGAASARTMLRLLPMSDRDKDAEILALRHQITVLERQLGNRRVRFNPSDRAFLAALLHPLPTPITDPDQKARRGIRQRDRLDGILHEYEDAA